MLDRENKVWEDGPEEKFVTLSAPALTITTQAGKLGGKPCVRGLRISVWDVLGWLGAGMTEDEILDDHPDLQKSDFAAIYKYAADFGRKRNPV